MDRMFLTDKYRDLYDLPYNYFIVQLIKSENDILNKSNYAISDYITKIGNQEDLIGIHNWIDKLSKDEININRTSPTIEVRNKIQTLFCGKLADLMNKGFLIKTTIPHNVIESVFFKVSVNIYTDTILKLSEQNKEKKKSGCMSSIALLTIFAIFMIVIFNI